MPVLVFEKREDIPGPLQALENDTQEVEGKFHVKVEGISKVSEFRDNNVKLMKERDDLNRRVESLSQIVGEDPDAFKARLAELNQIERDVQDNKLVKQEGFQEALQKRVQENEQNFKKQLEDERKSKGQAEERARLNEQRWRESTIERALMDAMHDPKLGVRTEAFVDLKERARRIFRVHDDGKLVPYEGDTIIYSADASAPMSLKEWLGRLRQDAPYFFKDSTGGGATGGSDGAGRKSPIRSKQDLNGPGEKSKFISEYGLAAFEKLPLKPTQSSPSAAA
jgi:hypothetical protein